MWVLLDKENGDSTFGKLERHNCSVDFFFFFGLFDKENLGMKGGKHEEWRVDHE